MKLTPQQQAILETTDISVAVSAGAGCGKTFVLTERFMGFLRARVGREDPLAGIVAITFTNKAAREMRHRVRQACARELAAAPAGEVAYWIAVMRGLDAARISTIHSFASTLLRRFSVEAGLDPAFTLPESSLSASFIQRAVNAAYCELLERGHQDAHDFVVRFGLERAFELMGELVPGLRTHDDPSRFDDCTPEELWTRWKSQWDGQCVPAICKNFITSPAVAAAIRLLERHEPTHPKMVARRGILLKLFANPPQSDPDEWFNEIKNSATVQGGGRADAWADASIYDEIKTSFETLRKEVKKAQLKFKTAQSPNHDATAIALQAHRVAKEIFLRLEEHKRRESVVEFEDLLCRTRDLLRHRPALARRAAGGLELLMVDEFQDTDPIQAEIVRLLCGEALATGRLFLVGDAKQSIYRFRGADPRVFAQLRGELPRQGHLPLSMNFRSQPAILDFVNYTFETEIPDYEPLQASCEQLSPEPAIEFLFSRPEEKTLAADGRREEARWIAVRLAQLLDDETPRVRDADSGALRRVQPGDIAILFRALTSVHLYEQALSEHGLPYYLVKSRAFFLQQEIHDIAHLCRWLEDPSDELSLAGVLRSPMFGLTDDTLFALKPEKRRALAEGLNNPPPLPEQQAGQVRRAYEVLLELRTVKDCLSLVDLLNLAIERTGYDAALLTEHLGPRKLANLQKLVELARSFAETGPVTLTDFARRLQDAVHEEAREEVAATHPEVGDVLRLMSIHQAKGLEFPVVVLADMEWTNNEGRSPAVYHPDLGPIFPTPPPGPTLEDEQEAPPDKNHLGVLIGRELERAEDEAEWTRLLYVALTRPRDHLILSACLDESKPLKSPWMRLLARRFDLSTGLPPVDPYLGSINGQARKPNELPRVRVHHTEPRRADRGERQRTAKGGLKDFREIVARATPEPLPELMKPIAIDPAGRAAFTATELTECDSRARSDSTEDEPDGEHFDRESRLLESSEAMPTTSSRSDAKTIGTLVHHVLEHLDFSAIDVADAASITRIVEESQQTLYRGNDRELTNAAARKVTMLLDSPWRNILADAKRLHREISFRLHWPDAENGAPIEIVGVIDGLYQDAAGEWHLYDYKITEQSQKTDADLLARYELQMLIYAVAIERALGVRPKTATLIRLETQATQIPVELSQARLKEAAARIDQAIAGCRTGCA